ncbi:vacuolar protein sorting-associated protein BRO1 [Ceratobasidium sp. AG-Ba]|nr:vacuolar protein sorting-associated protein BRO1 [Ceratobasidium sp. AG-Ba]
MPNQLHIPFKHTPPAHIHDAVGAYIEFHHPDAHPDAFKWDIARWTDLRRDGVGGYVHVDRLDASLLYHAHLVLLSTKFPANIGLTITYEPAFPSAARRACSAEDLVFERACVLFNLAALYSQLGTAASRSSAEDIKLHAAGVIQYLSNQVIPALASSLGQSVAIPSELTEPALKSLELLMLAQAQECFWQRASMGEKDTVTFLIPTHTRSESYKDGTLSKLAKQTSIYYENALSAATSVSPSAFPQEWINHLSVKKHHFEGVAQFRQSRSDLHTHKYGIELGRLKLAQKEVKLGLERASKGVAKAVIDDIKSLSKTLDSNFIRAQKDNDLIYHQTIPPESTLPPIAGADMVQGIVNNKLQNPALMIGDSENALFSGLVAYGVRVAVELYIDRRDNWIKEEVEGRAKELDAETTKLLQKLNLPGALDVLDKPAGIPPSLLRRSEEIRSMGGAEYLQQQIDEVQTLGASASGILEEAFDLLDTEAAEDETFFAQLPEGMAQTATDAGYSNSHVANKELTAKANNYRQILDNAASSDAVVRSKWEEWEENVEVLSSEPDQMERLIPSHSTSASSAEATQAHTYARAIRAGLEHLEDLRSARARCVESARQRANTDDIKPRIMREAAGLARWVEVKPAMFEEAIEEEMGKFDRYRDSVEEGREKQEQELERVEHLTELLIQARTNDPVLKQREAALQSLDLAYHRYLEVLSNVTEGAKFYAQFSDHLSVFQEECSRWVDLRRAQRKELLDFIAQQSRPRPQPNKSKPKGKSRARSDDGLQQLANEPEPTPATDTLVKPQPQVSPAPQVESDVQAQAGPSSTELLPSRPDAIPPPLSAFKLPAPGSSEWEDFELPSPPAPPVPTPRKPTRTKTTGTATPGRKTRSKGAAE